MDKPTAPTPIDPASTVLKTSQQALPPLAIGRRVFSTDKPGELPYVRNSSVPNSSTIFKTQEALTRPANLEDPKTNTSQIDAKRFANPGRLPGLEGWRTNTNPDGVAYTRNS